MPHKLSWRSRASLAFASVGLSIMPVDVDAGIFDRLFRKERSRPAAVPTHSPNFGYHRTQWRPWPGCVNNGQLPPGVIFVPHSAGGSHSPMPFGTPPPMTFPPTLIVPHVDAAPAPVPPTQPGLPVQPGHTNSPTETRSNSGSDVREPGGTSRFENPLPPQPNR